MNISLTKTHPAAEQLANLTASLRAIKREEREVDIPHCLASAVNITEINHGNHTKTYTVNPGTASSEDAITSYQYIRKHYPSILHILCFAASRNASNFSIEIGISSKQDSLNYSHHDLLRIMPRILALFRGTVQTK